MKMENLNDNVLAAVNGGQQTKNSSITAVVLTSSYIVGARPVVWNGKRIDVRLGRQCDIAIY